MKVHITITDDGGKTYDGTLDFEKSTKNSSPKISIENKSQTSLNNEISINMPENLIESLMKLEERKLFPILWSFSSQPIMIVEDFINACSEKGFMFSPSWLPSAGGHFKARLIKEDKMLTETKLKIKGRKTWKLTDVGKIKLRKELANIKKIA